MTEGIGPILLGRLILAAGSAEAACAADAALLRSVEGIGGIKSEQIRRNLAHAAEQVDAELSRCREMGVTLICQDEPAYPTMLKVIPDPPAVLYVRGTLEARDLNAVAIVGSRRCSHYGREQAERLAGLLAQAGVTVISGGARGIDSASHRGALAAPGGRTIAVLGCGANIVYPPENDALFVQIAQRGALISEFPLDSPPLKENFPRRNRIISGLSRGVLVVEADITSGALITARQAGDEHGRPVFALPGRVDNPLAAGTHALIRDGAILVTNLEEILDGLGPLPHQATVPETPQPAAEIPATTPTTTPQTPRFEILSDRQKRILECIGLDPTGIDGIITASELPAEIVLQELTMMSLRGVVKRVDGQNYVKSKSAGG